MNKTKSANSRTASNVAMLQEKNTFLEKMIGLISHDILVPLQYINKSAARLASNYESISAALRQETIEEISITSACLAELVQTLLQWTNKNEKDSFIEFNALQSLQSILPLHQKLLANHDTKLELQINPELRFHYNPVLFRIIIHNLVINSLKFTYGGKVTVHCGKLPEGYLIEVSDTGTGMPPGIIDKLEQFNTVPSAESLSGEKGWGMGYAIIFQLLKACHGRIHITSSPGNGTKVQVVIRRPVR